MIFGRKKNKSDATKGASNTAIDVKTATPEQLLDLACLAEDKTVREQAIARIAHQSELVYVIDHAKYPDARLQAAELISEVDVMRKAYAVARKKDKTAGRVLRAKLETIEASKKAVKAREDALHNVMDESHRLATGAWSPAFSAQYHALLEKWKSMEPDVSMEEKLRFQNQQEQIEAVLDEHRPYTEAPQKQEAICQSLELICGALQQASLLEAQIACTDWATVCDGETELWKQVTELVDAPPELIERFELVSSSLRNAIHVAQVLNHESQEAEDFSPTALQRIMDAVSTANWRMGDAPIWFFELNALVAEVQQNQKDEKQAEEAERGDIHKAFGALRRAVEDGKLVPAKSMSGRLEAKLNSSTLVDAERYQEQLEAINQELSKLIDWNEFATAPKYESLCKAMEHLAEQSVGSSKEAIEARTEAVRGLQTEWKELGRSDASDQYWERFQAAANKAYEPAQAYFEKLRAQREQNLQQREKICEKLTAVLEAAIENSDWKSLEKQLFYARRDWHNFRGVERKAGKAVKERFEHLLQRIETELAPQYEAGIGAKQALIEKMRGLADGDINQHALNQAKELQAAWKMAGITPRDEGQRLWEEFNALAQRVFDAARTQRNQLRAQENAKYDEARLLIDALKGLEPATDADKAQALQSEFEGISWGDERGVQKLQVSFERELERFEAARDALKQGDTQADINELKRLADICTKLELGVADAEKTALLEQWGEPKITNSNWSKMIARRYEAAVSGVKVDTATTDVRRLLCVRLEILLDQESPRGDKPMRMEYQLAQLQNRNRQVAPVTAQDLEIEWYTSLTAEAAVQAELEQRFFKLLEA